MRPVSRLLRGCGWIALTVALIVPVTGRAQGGGNGRGSGSQCAPGEVCTQSVTPPGGDTSPPAITFTPGTGTTVYAAALTVTVGFCDNATLSTVTRTITLNGSSAPYTYTTSTKSGCGAYGSAQVPLTLVPGSNTLAAGVCDGSGNCTTRSATYTYVNNADQTLPTVQIAPGTQTTSTASFYATEEICAIRN